VANKHLGSLAQVTLTFRSDFFVDYFKDLTMDSQQGIFAYTMSKATRAIRTMSSST